MRILYEICRPCGTHINEDVIGHTGPYYWVIDGATEVFDNHRISEDGDVFWTVQTLNDKLKDGDTDLPIKEFVVQAVKQLRDDALGLFPELFSISKSQLPSYAICCVKYNKGFIEYLCLGDCSLFISDRPGERYTDSRVQPFHFSINEVKKKYSNNPHLYKSEVNKAVREMKVHLNTKDGYWLGNCDPEIIEQAVCGKIPVNIGDRFLICSDGFRPSLDELQLLTFSDLDIFNVERLKFLLTKQHELEQDYKKLTGINISDDTSVVLVEI